MAPEKCSSWTLIKVQMYSQAYMFKTKFVCLGLVTTALFQITACMDGSIVSLLVSHRKGRVARLTYKRINCTCTQQRACSECVKSAIIYVVEPLVVELIRGQANSSAHVLWYLVRLRPVSNIIHTGMQQSLCTCQKQDPAETPYVYYYDTSGMQSRMCSP